jgi:hypothetical protein
MAVHGALAQRIAVRYHMAALTREELTGYLAHRLRLASVEVLLFDPSAEEAISFSACRSRSSPIDEGRLRRSSSLLSSCRCEEEELDSRAQSETGAFLRRACEVAGGAPPRE